MKRTTILLFTVLLIFTACTRQHVNTTTSNTIKVGVFDKNGDSPFCITDAMEALKIDKDIAPRVISAADIMMGNTEDIDVYLFPGGSGSSEAASLGEKGRQRIIDLVKKQGKGIVGICAGAYLLTGTENYTFLNLSGYKAIDVEHDHRGHGLSTFSLTQEGEKIFPELADREISYCQYYEGPVMVPVTNNESKYTKLATMLSDVHTIEGTPANMTNNKPFITINEIGKGKTASVVGHPECTPGMRWMIPRLVRVVANKKIISYDNNVVKPDLYHQEILFTKEQQAKYRLAKKQLCKSKEEKLKAMQELADMSAWSAKKLIPPMLRDQDFEVRLLAAKLTVQLERTDAINDVKATILNESDKRHKKLLEKELNQLQSLYGKHSQ
ncbi:hypothetical protein OAT16_05255 [Prolixibacteraceae bacterium]|nr:hypothetical protein [Prolixibacteraceae bacterium]